MRKIWIIMALAIATCMISAQAQSDEKRFGYFFREDDLELDPGEFVTWDTSDTVLDEDRDIFILPSDHTHIVIKHTGFYVATFLLTGISVPIYAENFGEVQFALRLNDGETVIPGSTYATGVAFIGLFGLNQSAQVEGQVIFIVTEPNSTLTLENHCELEVFLNNDAGTDEPEVYGPNVTASLIVERLSDLD